MARSVGQTPDLRSRQKETGALPGSFLMGYWMFEVLCLMWHGPRASQIGEHNRHEFVKTIHSVRISVY